MGLEERAAESSVATTRAESLEWSQWVVLIIATVTVVLLLLAGRYGHQQQRGKLPPGPRNWPGIGAFLSMDPILHKAFEKLIAQFGPVVHFRLGCQAIVLVSSAEVAEELLKHRDVEFADRAATMNKLLAKYTGMDSAAMAFANYDSFFKICRKISITELFTSSKLKSWEDLRARELAVAVQKIFRQIETSNQESNGEQEVCTVVRMREAGIAMIQNIIFMMFIGKRFDDLPEADEIREFPRLLEDQMAFVMKFNVIDFFPFLEPLDPQGMVTNMQKFEKRQRRFFEKILERQRQARKLNSCSSRSTNLSSSNFVDTLLRFQEEGDSEISDKVVLGVVLSMWMGGIHTTASQLEWVLLELARHPNLLQRLQLEIDGVVGKDRPVQEADLQSMPFLNGVVLETLRLHPISTISFPHVNLRPSTLGGYYIPPNTGVFLSIQRINRDPEKWIDPLQFNPDRFVVNPALVSKPISANGSNFHLLTFGSGRRMCPGYNLAMVLLLRVVATLVHAFDFSPPPGCSAEDLSAEEGDSHIQHPKSILLLTCRPRLLPHVYQNNVL